MRVKKPAWRNRFRQGHGVLVARAYPAWAPNRREVDCPRRRLWAVTSITSMLSCFYKYISIRKYLFTIDDNVD
ncbi:hypothetical protein CPter91_4480 [Collimonas pratensis]|uniref:Uncharacterized protein n=1 Tax=Collimonas pratensis TaxID=279113 RepID=A0A127Q9R0_9BURK|nr:hypothetical protein CPter91_4480 [Collimonas pratensis]